MATANASLGSSNLRQTRTNPSRQSKTAGRTTMMNHISNPFNHVHSSSISGGMPPGGAGATTYVGGSHYTHQHPPGMYPGIHHFTDTIDALPREFRRHTSLLNEVDGKAFALEAQLPKLLRAAAELISDPIPVVGIVEDKFDGFQSDVSQAESTERLTARRQVFQNIRNTLGDLLPTMDEKNHVARNAYLSLKKDVNRLEMVYPYIENEISDEARIGSRTHWAYLNKPTKPVATASERPRREAANRDHREAAHHGEDNHREQRRETGGRKQRRNQVDHDGDEARARKTNAAGKGRGGGGGEVLQVNQSLAVPTAPSKRRRVEKSIPTPTSTGMERSVSAATNLGMGKGAIKESPAPEAGKKRARGPNAAASSRKRTNTLNSNVDAPLRSPAVPDVNPGKPTSTPTPNASNRPPTSRLQQTAAVTSNGRQRPSSSTSNRNINSNKGIVDAKASVPKELSFGLRVEPSPPLPVPVPAATASTSVTVAVTSSSKSGVVAVEPKADTLVLTNSGDRETSLFISTATATKLEPLETTGHPSPIPQSVASKGRSSKTSTPVVSTFSESQRSRPSRATATTLVEGSVASSTTSKRSHKKGAGNAAAIAPTARQLALAAAAAAEDEDSSRLGDDEDDEGEPRYCYCNQVSFGDMVACDMENCPREWFHLSCVGLTKPPSKSVKWYCNECKETMKKGRSNGR